MNWLKQLFSRKPKPPPVSIELLTRWQMIDPDPSPWGSETYIVTVIDVRDGWVRYAFGSRRTSITGEQRIDSFLRLYRKIS